MGRGNEAKRNIRAELLAGSEGRRAKILQTIFRFFKRIERQRGAVLGFFRLVVERSVFFLQMSRIGQHDAAQIDG